MFLICVCCVLLWVPPGWAQTEVPLAHVDIVSLPNSLLTQTAIEHLTSRDVRIQRQAMVDLVRIGSPAVPALMTALQSANGTSRLNAAAVLSDLGVDATPAVPVLIKALQDRDEQVRLYATLALGNIGVEAKAAETALILALQDRSSYVRIYALAALRGIGVDAKVVVPALVKALSDLDPQLQASAANALGAMGVDTAVAIPDLIELTASAVPELTKLVNAPEKYVEFAAIRALGNIAGGFEEREQNLSWTELDRSIATFAPVLKSLEERHNLYAEAGIARIHRPLAALQIEKETRWLDRSIEWLLAHKLVFGITVYLTVVPLLALLLLQFAPLWLLKINNVLKPYTDFAIPQTEIKAPLRYLLFIGWWHYHPRVLDAWVTKYLPIASAQFSQRETVSQRSCYLPIPVVINGDTRSQLTPDSLRSTFSNQRNRLVIWGEGGVGKTSLACQIAQWGMAELEPERLCEHRMLPILLEEDFRVVEGKSALLEAISGQLQLLVDEPEPICQELLSKLLRQRRILVIIDRFSELNPTTRAAIQPDSPDFAVNALIVTSRIEEKLGRVNKTTVKPLRLENNKLSSFMEAYLMQRGQRDKFTDAEFFAICTRLSQMVGQGQITVLLAKLYAEQAISQPGNVPTTVPDLMLGYLNELNRDLTTDKIPDRVVHQVAKLIAWQCVSLTYQPHFVQRDDLTLALTTAGINEPEIQLEYLEHRLYLIQTVGTSQQQFRFCLDPLAEYLAAMYLVESYGGDRFKWDSFLKTVGNMQVPIQGFLLAVRDCYLVELAVDAVAEELARLADVS
jgi:HEAT repeat protein